MDKWAEISKVKREFEAAKRRLESMTGEKFHVVSTRFAIGLFLGAIVFSVAIALVA